MFKYLFGEKMSGFIGNNAGENELITRDYPISTLPDFILESEYFKNWSDLCPNEHMITLSNKMYLENLQITCNEDLYKIIECESLMLFSSKARIEILRNFNTYWMENPNSSGLRLPVKNCSYFGDQLLGLLEGDEPFYIMMYCMKNDYRDLFEYIYQRDGAKSFRSSHPFAVFPLNYYAIVNHNNELLNRAIEIGCPLRGPKSSSSMLFEPVIDKNNIAAARILIKHGVKIEEAEVERAAEFASIELFRLILDTFMPNINQFCFTENKGRILYRALKNIENLKELFLNRDICFDDIDLWKNELLKFCITKSMSLEVVKFLEEYFSYTLEDYRKSKPKNEDWHKYISDTIVEKDNIDLFNYMRGYGFIVGELSHLTASEKRCVKLTPGFIKFHQNYDKNSL
jgi:hypothetical protein